MSNLNFKDTGNDAVDFSGSNVELQNLIVYGAGDKAISVGEKCKIDIENVAILNSVIGIASKDNSSVVANKINIDNTKYGIVSYMKKSEYGPSKIYLNNILITNSEEKYLVEKGSAIIVNNEGIPSKDFDFKTFIK